MKNLLQTFEKSFRFALPMKLITVDKLIPLDNEDEEKALLFGSRVSNKEGTYLSHGEIFNLLETSPVGYFLIGFWGHGVNSYAFYYSRVDSWSKICFRLPFGGVYMDNTKNAELIKLFLNNFILFEERLKGNATSFMAIDSMGEALYKVERKDGGVLETRESLWGTKDWQLKLK